MDSIIKCACGHPDCKVEIQIESGERIWFVDRDGMHTAMDVNVSSLNFLISRLEKVRNRELGLWDWETE